MMPYYRKVALATVAVILFTMFFSVVSWTYEVHKKAKALDKERHEMQSKIEVLQTNIKTLSEEMSHLRNDISRQREIYPVSRGGSRVLRMINDVEVTWYNDIGKTASGTVATAGRTAAVDPNLIPMGSRMHIIMPDGTTYDRIAEDTGGAVKGKIIDIRSDRSSEELMKMGRTHGATVYIVER